jgi:hypothetical protein
MWKCTVLKLTATSGFPALSYRRRTQKLPLLTFHTIRTQKLPLQGECASEPSAELLTVPTGSADILTLKPKQCLLLASEDVFSLITSSIWLDNLYVRVIDPSDGAERKDWFPAIVAIKPAISSQNNSDLYMTNVTFQGDGLGPTVGLGAAGANVYVQGACCSNGSSRGPSVR